MSRIIDADKLNADMYHEAFEKDSDMQKWDSGCWIRYKMFENVLKAQPTVEAPDINVGNMDTTTHDSIPAETGKNDGDRTSGDLISRQQAINALCDYLVGKRCPDDGTLTCRLIENEVINKLLPAQPDLGKYEYHYDHTDCIWYRPEARNRCPVTCAQYRDGWNDAMNYIFRDGKGYRPYRRGEQYDE